MHGLHKLLGLRLIFCIALFRHGYRTAIPSREPNTRFPKVELRAPERTLIHPSSLNPGASRTDKQDMPTEPRADCAQSRRNVRSMLRLAPTALLLPLALLTPGCGRKSPAASGADAAPTVAAPPQPPAPPVSALYQGAQKARLDEAFAAVVLADGKKTVVPLESLAPQDLDFLTRLAREQPLATGKSSVVVVESTDPLSGPKNTIVVSKREGALETVQLCSPNAPRDQIGATCMLYARAHWLDIAGYYTELPDIFKIINDTPHDRPWAAAKYRDGLTSIMTGFKSKPLVHKVAPGSEQFEWARQELRRGRPLLAALPREVEMALPAEFLAQRPWSGGDIGHQIVVNGFTWNRETGEGSFHIVNSWAELLEFDLDLKYAGDGGLVFEASLSPVGEKPTAAETAKASEVVQDVTFLKPIGSAKLFAVTTNLGVRKVVAPDAAAARRMVEEKQ